jgi:hypothetical protein
MLWEATMLNRLYKSQEFGRVKPKMYNDRLIYVIDDSPKYVSHLAKISASEKVVEESEILIYFDISDEER